jgi:hypothetical protein
MSHRVREAMRDLSDDPLAGEGKTVERRDILCWQEKTSLLRSKTVLTVNGKLQPAFGLVALIKPLAVPFALQCR